MAIKLLVLGIRDYDPEDRSPVRYEKYSRDGRDNYDDEAEGKTIAILTL